MEDLKRDLLKIDKSVLRSFFNVKFFIIKQECMYVFRLMIHTVYYQI